MDLLLTERGLSQRQALRCPTETDTVSTAPRALPASILRESQPECRDFAVNNALVVSAPEPVLDAGDD
jgi:hypothetical protein